MNDDDENFLLFLVRLLEWNKLCFLFCSLYVYGIRCFCKDEFQLNLNPKLNIETYIGKSLISNMVCCNFLAKMKCWNFAISSIRSPKKCRGMHEYIFSAERQKTAKQKEKQRWMAGYIIYYSCLQTLYFCQIWPTISLSSSSFRYLI